MLLPRSAFIVQSSVVRSLRPCLTAFLNILRGALLLSQTCRPVKLQCAHRVFPQPASPDRSSFPLHLSIFCLSGDHQAQRTSWNRRVKLVTGYQDQGRVFPVKRDSACSTIDDATIADLKDLPGVVYVK